MEIINEAKKRFQLCFDAEREFRTNAAEDIRFYKGDQWEHTAKHERENSGRPALVINRLPAFVRQVTNESRQNKPFIKVEPVASEQDKYKADVYSGMIRNIEYMSNADSHYDTSSWNAAVVGKGYLIVDNEYENDETFNQILTISSVQNPLSVYYDPNSVQLDGSDAEYCFIVKEMSKDEFERTYPDEVPENWADYHDAIWFSEDNVRIATYYFKKHFKEKLYHVAITDMLTQETIESITSEKPETSEFVRILNSRTVDKAIVRKILMTGHAILEETDWDDEFIPVVPVIGEQFYVDGVKYTCGIIRNTIDSQRMYNFNASLQAELVALSPKSPYIGAEGQFEDHEHEWRDANVKNYAYLAYKPVALNGTPIGAPQRQSMEPAIQAVAATRQQSAEDLKAITGIFDPSLGAQGNETSGKAIIARQEQTNTGNYHYHDNLIKSIRQVGRILVRAIPRYYDTERMVRIIKPDNKQEIIAINNGDIDLKSNNDFDVVVTTGPSYSTRRQEAVDSMMSLTGAYPNMMPLISDLMVQNMDWPGSDIIAKRLKTQVPPEVLAASEEMGNPKDTEARLQQTMKQIQQMNQQLELAVSTAEKLKMELDLSKDENKNLKLKADIEIMKAEMDQRIEAQRLALDERKMEAEILIRQAELELQSRQLDLQGDKNTIQAVGAMSKLASDVDTDAMEIGNTEGIDHQLAAASK